MRKRIIPVLLIDAKKRLVKTERFGARTYIGDPFNVVRLFNEKEVDEICILDIDATANGLGPDIGFIEELASECFMPLSYGGGIQTLDQCEQLNRAGVEKFVLGNGALDHDLIRALVSHLGTQAVTVCVDVIGEGEQQRCVTRSGKIDTGCDPVSFCRKLQGLGVGEIILQSVDRDGMRAGMDLALIRRVSDSLSIPLIALGGARDLDHLAEALHVGASAAASGSAFSFIGRLRAVLVTYPAPEELDVLARKLAT